MKHALYRLSGTLTHTSLFFCPEWRKNVLFSLQKQTPRDCERRDEAPLAAPVAQLSYSVSYWPEFSLSGECSGKDGSCFLFWHQNAAKDTIIHNNEIQQKIKSTKFKKDCWHLCLMSNILTAKMCFQPFYSREHIKETPEQQEKKFLC